MSWGCVPQSLTRFTTEAQRGDVCGLFKISHNLLLPGMLGAF